MPFRIWWHPGQAWSWYRANPETLAGYVKRAGGIDCYSTLNVWAKPEQGTPCNYDYGFDFDSLNISESAADASRVAEYLTSIGCAYRLYFSGSKGIHVVVPHELTGMPPRLDGGHVCKLFQRALKETHGLKTLDTEIHGISRQWRIPNTVNSKSGLYKVHLTLAELGNLLTGGIEAVRELAKSPRPETTPFGTLAICEPLQERLKPFCEMADEANRKREQLQKLRLGIGITALPVCIRHILTEPKRVVQQAKSWGKRTPSRNQLTFVAATFLKNHAGASEPEALEVLGEVWQGKVAHIASSSPDEIRRSTATCVRTVYHRTYTFSCGMAIGHGCSCSPRCPLYVPLAEADKNNGRKPEKEKHYSQTLRYSTAPTIPYKSV